MKRKQNWKQYENHLIMLITFFASIIILIVRFDFYYDLNDDLFLRDIMAGSYTGVPDGHSIYTLYPLGILISFLYKLYRSFPWYGAFLFLCQAGSLYLAGVRLLRFCKSLIAKLGCLLLFSLFLWGVMLPHMIALHYTFISAVMAAAAVFLFVTTPKNLTVRQFVTQNILSIILVVLSYLLRPKMLLLLFPFIGLAGIFRWSDEEKIFQKENFRKYGIVVSGIIFLMLVSTLINTAAYGGSDWKEFFSFCDARTVVYDYHLDIVTSGEHKEFLYSIGLDDAQQELLSNYNFGLDERINTQLMEEIAGYAASDVNYIEILPTVISDYSYRILHAVDAPYNMLVIFLYLCVGFIGLLFAFTRKEARRKWAFIWKLLLLGMTRSALWMFILVRGRYPERITNSLYFAEILLLTGMLCVQLATWLECRKDAPAKRSDIASQSTFAVLVLFGLLCACCIPKSIRETSADAEKREFSHRKCLEISQYCRANPANFYFEDVYSMVDASQKIFCDMDNSLSNYDIMGGWVCKSPLYYEKLGNYNLSTMEEGLFLHDNVYFIAAGNRDIGWLTAYYEAKGIMVRVEQVDFIGDAYAVYRLQKN